MGPTPSNQNTTFTMSTQLETENPFVSQYTSEPEPTERPAKVTPINGIPLPENAGPERVHKYIDGGYRLPDPAKTKRSSTRVLLLLDSTLANALNDTRPLISLEKETLMRSVINDPQRIASLSPAAEDTDIESVLKYYDTHGHGAVTADVAKAIVAWINAYDYAGEKIENMPVSMQPYVRAYAEFCQMYGLSFDDIMSHRLITEAGADNVSPNDGEYVVCNTNRVYHDEDGNVVSLRLTTSSSPQRRMAGYSACAGFARRATRMLGNTSRSGWDAKKLESFAWQDARFGVLNIPRFLDESGHAHATVFGLDAYRSGEMAEVAKQLYNANRSGEGLVDDELFAPYDPVADAIAAVEDPNEMAELFERYRGVWTHAHTALAFRRTNELHS